MLPSSDVSRVVDLAVLGDACRPVVAWFDALQAGRAPDFHALDRAIHDLRRLPAVGGRLGRAIAVVTGGGGGDLDETLAAIELLRHAAHRPIPVAPERARPKRRVAPRRRYDLPLPGLGVDEFG